MAMVMTETCLMTLLIFHAAGVFCMYPQSFMTKTSQSYSDFYTATLLIFVIFALKDASNPRPME